MSLLACCCDKTEEPGQVVDHGPQTLALYTKPGEEEDDEAQLFGMLSDLMVEFRVHLEKKPNTPLGLSLDPLDKITLYVSNIKEGLVDDYNELADPQKKVLIGDYIVGVNGILRDAKKMGTCVREDKKVDLTIRHPREWKATLERHEVLAARDGSTSPRDTVSTVGSESDWASVISGDSGSRAGSAPSTPRGETKRSSKLGAELEYNSRCSCVMFRKIKNKGPIAKWNAQNPEYAIKTRDRIVAVDGEKGPAMHLLQLIKGFDRKLEVTLSRPHPIAAEENPVLELRPTTPSTAVPPSGKAGSPSFSMGTGDSSPPPRMDSRRDSNVSQTSFTSRERNV